jgi:hypothetical protein
MSESDDLRDLLREFYKMMPDGPPPSGDATFYPRVRRALGPDYSASPPLTSRRFLQKTGARLVHDDRWMVWSFSGEAFAVYEQKPRQKMSRLLVETADEAEALRVLGGGGV